MSRRRCRIVGAGPAGLYLAIELARAGTGFDVEVCAQPDHSGVGVVLDEEFVGLLARRDPPSGEKIRAACQTWSSVRIAYRDDELVTGGHRILGLRRQALIGILRARAAVLGVTFGGPAAWPAPRAPGVSSGIRVGDDVLVAADGAGSRVRASRAVQHGVTVTASRSEFLWMTAPCTVIPGFWLTEAGGGVIVGHAYPVGDRRSAVVVECLPEVGRNAGLRGPDQGAVEIRISALFAEHTGGGRLRAQTFPWRPFRTVTCRSWSAGGQVLIGDAAHTTHYSVGSGTRLAVEDAISLAAALTRARDPGEAFRAYQREREPVVSAVQTDARSSELWFEDIARHVRLPADQLAFALRCRREVNTFGWLARRDPPFAVRVMRALAGDPRCPATAAATAAAGEPRLLPLRVGRQVLASRVIRAGDTRLPQRGQLGVTLGPARPAPGNAAAAAGTLEPMDRRCAPGAVGVIVSEANRTADLKPAIGAAGFVVVPAARAGQRIERTRLAERLRNEYGCTVLLWSPALTDDEANTLIAAGRIDGYITAVPPAADGAGSPG
jgi:2-polyprenyl-6-methoxyphenol hydroxylase-like FAD-dependent oxidoreductase